MSSGHSSLNFMKPDKEEASERLFSEMHLGVGEACYTDFHHVEA